MRSILILLISILFSCTPSEKSENLNETDASVNDSYLELTENEHETLIPILEDYDKSLNEELAEGNTFSSLESPLSWSQRNYLRDYEKSIITEDYNNGLEQASIAVAYSGELLKCGSYDPSTSNMAKGYLPNSYFSVTQHMLYPEIAVGEFFIDIPLRWHTITDRQNVNYYNTQQLEDQLELLNQAFKPIGIQFSTDTIFTYAKSQWLEVWNNPEDSVIFKSFTEMANMINVDHQKINIVLNYSDVLGQANFPWTDEYLTVLDLIVLNYSSLPGGRSGDYNYEGKTLVHELGHFFGLFHTFHQPGSYTSCHEDTYNGCDGVGDRVADTPYQKFCFYDDCQDCEEDTCDSCPLLEGPDPLDNYMGYNIDDCLSHFTLGQYQRMYSYLLMDRRYLLNN